jgi:hypothetical protein
MRDFAAGFRLAAKSRLELFANVSEIDITKGYRLDGDLLMVIGIEPGGFTPDEMLEPIVIS